MSTYFHLRAVPPSALRNSPTWFQRLFEDDWDTVRERIGRHREEVLDKLYGDVELLYCGIPPNHAPEGPRTHVVLGGRPVSRADSCLPPFLLLTASQVTGVAAYLKAAEFEGPVAAGAQEAAAAAVPRAGGGTRGARPLRGDPPRPDRVLRADGPVRRRGGAVAGELTA